MYEFIDDADRYEVQTVYWDFLESAEEDPKKAIKALKKMIKQDANFFDPYITLSEYYAISGDHQESFNILKTGYELAMKMVLKRGKFPDKLSWLFTENRHIIRIMYNYALKMWEIGEKSEALRVLQQLLASNTNDNIGARYAILALLKGYEDYEAWEEEFESADGYGLDAMGVEKWFNKFAQKYPEELGWWFDEVEDI